MNDRSRQLSTNVKGEHQSEKHPKHNTEQLTTYVVIFYFIISFCLIQIFQILDLSLFNFFRLLFVSVGLCFFIPIKLFRKRWQLSYYEYSIFNFIFWGPLLLLLVFVLNISFTSPNYVETHKIMSATLSENQEKVTLTLENNKYEEKPYLREIDDHDKFKRLSTADRLNIEFADGLFGIRIIKNKYLD